MLRLAPALPAAGRWLLGGPLLSGLTACGDTSIDRLLPEEAPPRTTEAPSVPPSLEVPRDVAVRRVVLTPQQRDQLAVATMQVQHRPATYTLSLPGAVEPAPDHVAQVSAPISGRVARLYAHEGESVRKGDVLLELESLEYANLIADHLQAEAEAAYLRERTARLRILVDKKISPRSALDRIEADLARTEASVDATHARLRALGLDPAVVDRSNAPEADRPLLPITAPLSGTIDRHQIELGQSVTAYEAMLTIVNPGRVLIKGYVSPDDAAALAPGDSVVVLPEHAAGHELAARVTTINPAVDPESKSVTINILTDTREGWPMPGQTVRLALRARTPQPVISLPSSAVVYDGDRPVVYVQIDAQTYERRPITIARTGEDDVIVGDGLADGERVATSQVFSLKALDRYAQYAE